MDPIDSRSPVVSKDGSFYGVFVETERDDGGIKKVFTELRETLSVVKYKKTARFKLFRSETEAERFSIFGQESPVKDIDKNNTSNDISNNVHSTSFSFKSLKSEDLVVFRRLIESGELEKIKQAVYSNPRFLVSSGDTPSIIQEGCRYNAMHVAARYNQPEIVHFIMECVTSSDFIKSLYGMEQSYLSRSEIITDLYLNTPDKAANDTPLHIASKFGHVNVVKELVSYDKCLLTCLNKYGQTPKDVICSRKNPDMYDNILNLIESGYFVPMWKSNDDCVQPTIGKPFSPKSPTVFPILQPQSESPKQLNPVLEIRALAGPMNETQALTFWKDWKSPVRKTLLSSTPQKCPTSPRQNEFNIKSIEKAGRILAEKRKVGWAEYWAFLDQIVDIKSDRGLDLLEKYLKQRFSMKVKDIPERYVHEPTTLLSPMSELCQALETMRIRSTQKEKSPKRSTLVPYTCLVKSCKVLGERLLKVIISECKNMQNIKPLANQLCHEVRHLLVLEDSFYSDIRFDSNIQGKIHERVAECLCQLLINHLDLNIDISSVLTKLQKYYAYHAIGSRSEITAACLVSLMCKIWHEKLNNINGMELIDDEENFKQWFLTIDPCSCNVEAKPPLKPIQLFLDDSHLKTSLENKESKNNTRHGYDSDEDIFSSAPTSPCSGYSSSDESNMFYNAERDFSYLLFARDNPINEDFEIFDAINGISVESNKYPWLYRWLYSMNDYNNVNNL